MTRHQAALFSKAYRALDAARHSIGRGDTETAVNRAYYAAFYAATSALLAKGEAPRTHKGAHQRFHLHFVASGPLPAEVGAVLPYAADARQQADYDAFTVFDQAAAADLITDVERFVQAVAEMTNPDQEGS